MKEKWNECIRQNEYGGVTNNPKSQYSKFPKVYCSCVFYFIKKIIYLVVSGFNFCTCSFNLCWGMQDIWRQLASSYSWQAGSSAPTRDRTWPLHWQRGVSATGPLGKSPTHGFMHFFFLLETHGHFTLILLPANNRQRTVTWLTDLAHSKSYIKTI